MRRLQHALKSPQDTGVVINNCNYFSTCRQLLLLGSAGCAAGQQVRCDHR
jgi:hypothetical protein